MTAATKHHRYFRSVIARTRPPTDFYLEIMLFDNSRDPYQLKNVAGSMPEVVRELTEELQRWLDKTKDPWKG